ncbi:MAG: hypothetical protein ACTHW3_04630 [Leucobacter sp.]
MSNPARELYDLLSTWRAAMPANGIAQASTRGDKDAAQEGTIARPGRPITPSGDRTQWGRILTRAGLRWSEPCIARHTAASEMIAAGIEEVRGA